MSYSLVLTYIATGAICQFIGYCMLSPGPPFKVIILAYTIIGVGESLQNVQANAFVAALGSNSKLGFLHASYGPCAKNMTNFMAN